MPSTLVYPDSSNNSIVSVHETYSIARTGGALTEPHPTDGNIRVGQRNNASNSGFPDYIITNSYSCWEGFERFNLSSIPAGVTVTDVLYTVDPINISAGDQSFTLETRINNNWPTSLTTADWISGSNLGSIQYPAIASKFISNSTSISRATLTNTANTLSEVQAALDSPTRYLNVMYNSDKQRLNVSPGAGSDKNGWAEFNPSTSAGSKITITWEYASNNTIMLGGFF